MLRGEAPPLNIVTTKAARLPMQLIFYMRLYARIIRCYGITLQILKLACMHPTDPSNFTCIAIIINIDY